MPYNRLARLAALGTAGLGFAVSAPGVDLFNAGFESGSYTLGTLTGQQGWIAYRDANPTAVQVATAAVFDGERGVKIDGALMELYPTGQYRGYYYPPINYDLSGTGNTVIEYSCDIRLVLDPADEFRGFAWQTQFYTALGGTYGGLGIEYYGDGTYEAYAFGFVGPFESTPYTPGDWVHVVARLDFTAATLTVSFGDVTLPAIPLDETDSVFGDADLTLICAEPFVSYAYVDNYRIQALGASDPCPCPGDFNGDNAVGLGDLTLFLSNFGGAPSNPCMDTDGDGLLGLGDLTQFLSSFGSTCP